MFKSFYTVTFEAGTFTNNKSIDKSDELSWICNNTAKGLRNNRDVFTANISSEISEQIKILSFQSRVKKIREILLKSGFQTIKNFSQHYWKYAFSTDQKNIDYIYDKEKRLGICGDSFSIGRVDGAIKSSKLISQEIISGNLK